MFSYNILLTLSYYVLWKCCVSCLGKSIFMVGIFIHRAKIFRPQFFGENLIWYFSGIIISPKRILSSTSVFWNFMRKTSLFSSTKRTFLKTIVQYCMWKKFSSHLACVKNVFYSPLFQKKLFTHLSSIAESTDEVDQNLLVIDELSEKNDTL